MSFSSCVSPDPQYKGETAIIGTIKKDGEAVAGVFVQLLDSHRAFVGEVRSDKQGGFRFFVGPGDWRIVCLAPGDQRAEDQVTIAQGEELDVDIRF